MENISKKIHVGFITERMLRGFGVDLIIDRTAKELVSKGFEVTVFCINTDGTFKNEKYKIVQIQSSLHHNPLKTEWSAFKALKRLDIESDIDIWIVETYPFFMATRVLSKPVIVVDPGIVSTKGMHLLRRMIFFYIKFIQNYFYFAGAARIINISEFTKSITPSILRKKQSVVYLGTDNYYIPNCKEVDFFREKNGFSKQDFILLYVGRLNPKGQPYKGTVELVGMFKVLKKRHKNLRLIMAGFGDDADKRWLESEGIDPFISPDDRTLSFLYSIANCYVSASKWEGFNLPLVESGHFNVPCVAYLVGAHGEVVDNKSGFLVQDRQEFLSKIENIIFDDSKRLELSNGAKRNANRFLWSNIGNEYKKIILDVLSADRSSVRQLRKIKNHEKGLVDVITLNYNGKEYLKPLFDSLQVQTYKNIRVTMVDNGSQDESIEYVQKNFSWVNLIKSKKNLFFSRGNNLAVSKTNGEYIFFVNNDIIVDPMAIQKMVDAMDKIGKYNIASIAPKMLSYKNKEIIDSVGVVMMSNGAPFNRGIGQIDIGQYNKVEEIFGACFGAVLVRRNIYECIVGPLDNSYFGYFEDVDWSYRSRLFGYKSYFCPEAVVYHDHSGTSRKLSYEWKYYLIQRNFLKTIIKNFQFKRMVLKAGWKVIEFLSHLRKTKSSERRRSIIKILCSTVFSLPGLLRKRFSIQAKRCVSDYECIKFSNGEHSFFDAVNYSPIFSLDMLFVMFSKLDTVNNFKDQKVSEIVARIAYLNERKTVMDMETWERQIIIFLESLEVYIGKKYVNKFIDSVVIKKTWRR